jgi:hypothetical protein
MPIRATLYRAEWRAVLDGTYESAEWMEESLTDARGRERKKKSQQAEEPNARCTCRGSCRCTRVARGPGNALDESKQYCPDAGQSTGFRIRDQYSTYEILDALRYYGLWTLDTACLGLDTGTRS